MGAEVHDQVGPLAGCNLKALHFGRLGQQALIRADHEERLVPRKQAPPFFRQRQDEEPGVRGIEETEPVPARVYFEKRENLAIEQDRVAVELRHPRRGGIAGDRILELPVGPEIPVADGDRDLEAPLGKVQGILDSIADEIHSHQSGDRVQPCDAHGMVVIEERAGVLVIGVVTHLRLPWNHPALWIPVAFRWNLRPVQVHHCPDHRLVALRAVQRLIDWQKVPGGKFIRPFHHQRLAGARFEYRPGEHAFVAPKRSRRNIAMNLGMKLPHSDAIARDPRLSIVWIHHGCRWNGGSRQGQRIDISSQRIGVERQPPHRRGHPRHSTLLRVGACCSGREDGTA